MQWFFTPVRVIRAFCAGHFPAPFYQFATLALVVVSGLCAGGIIRNLLHLNLI